MKFISRLWRSGFISPFKNISSMVWIGIGIMVVACPGAALAHQGEGTIGGLISGLTHPVFGYDHLLAMLAVGIWGAQMGGRSIWTLPVVFPLVMAVGGMVGTMGFNLPYVELFIALSVLVLGLVIMLALKPPAWIALSLISFFAFFHGYAHGVELPKAANPLAYGVGFVTSTGLIHVVGIYIGLGLMKLLGQIGLRLTGAVLAAFGLYIVAGAYGFDLGGLW